MAVVFDLNTRRKEARAAAKEPFELKIGNKKVVFGNPQDADWKRVVAAQDAAQAGNPEPMIRALLEDAEYEKFASERVSVAELTEILQAVQEHYGVPLEN